MAVIEAMILPIAFHKWANELLISTNVPAKRFLTDSIISLKIFAIVAPIL